MTIREFFRRNKPILNMSSIEHFAKVPSNTITHHIGKEVRKINASNEFKLIEQLKHLHDDLGKTLVHYYVKDKPAKTSKRKK